MVRKTQFICKEKRIHKIKELLNTYKKYYTRCNNHASLVKLGPVVRRVDIIVNRGHVLQKLYPAPKNFTLSSIQSLWSDSAKKPVKCLSIINYTNDERLMNVEYVLIFLLMKFLKKVYFYVNNKAFY